ncbi:MAG: hypothetical protein VX454_01465 [Pseudomonadota bacterium]|mgnify:FL=1|jgi:hypothetical protein|nr:hypothetical protein [Pseudomonadota bacterium]
MARLLSHTLIVVGLAGALALGGCSDADQPAFIERGDAARAGNAEPPVVSRTPSDTPTREATTNAASPPPGYTDGSGINEGNPDLTPPVLTPEAERGEPGARNVLVNFARAIEMREYDQAWAMLTPRAQQQWSRARFNGLFEGLREITVAVPDGTIEGAAGSSYYTSDAEITASDADGRPIRLEGPIILRRVNDVPGSSAEERRWHIDTIELSATH